MIPSAHLALLLALSSWGECRGGGRPCMRAVAHVAVNAARARAGPQALERTLRRLDCWHDRNRRAIQLAPRLPESTADGRAYRDARMIAAAVLAGRDRDLTHGATHYYAGHRQPAWAGRMRLVATIGGQRFLREREHPSGRPA